MLFLIAPKVHRCILSCARSGNSAIYKDNEAIILVDIGAIILVDNGTIILVETKLEVSFSTLRML